MTRSSVFRAIYLASALFAFAPSPARAQISDQRAQLKTLTEQATEKYDAGDYAAALGLFSDAYATSPTPTIGVYVARSQQALGRLVEAMRTYDQVIASRPLAAAESEPAPVRQAYDDAAKERAALIPRLATLEVVVEGPLTWALLENGKAVTPSTSGSFWLDPGRHTVTIQAEGYLSLSRQVELRDGERMQMSFGLEKVPTAAPPIRTPSVAPKTVSDPAEKAAKEQQRLREERERETAERIAAEEQERRTKEQHEAARRPYRVAGYLGIGVGAIGVAIGIVEAVDASVKKGKLADDCVGTQCAASAQTTLDGARSSANIATWSTIIGAGLITTGVTLLIIGGSAGADAEKHQTALSIAPGWLGLQRSF